MVGIIAGNAMLKALGGASFTCSLLEGITQVASYCSGYHKTWYCNNMVGLDHSG